MQRVPIGPIIKRRKELLLCICALVLGTLTVLASLTGWLEKENWGGAITVRKIQSSDAAPEMAPPDFSAIWEDGGRNPFGDAATALESGGKAQIPLPPPPPLPPEMPPPPAVRPIDLLTEGGR